MSKQIKEEDLEDIPRDKPYIDLGKGHECSECYSRYCICKERQDGTWKNNLPILNACMPKQTKNWEYYSEKYNLMLDNENYDDLEMAFEEIKEETKKEILKKIRQHEICINCGAEKESDLCNLCSKCLEEV